MIHVRHAAAAIASGMCETVLITHGESGRSGVGRTRNVVAPTSLAGQFEQPYGPRAAGPAGRPRGADFVHDPGVALHEDFCHPRARTRACTHVRLVPVLSRALAPLRLWGRRGSG